MKRITLGIIILLASSLPLYAGVTVSTVDKILLVDSSMLIYVYPKNGVTNPPTCHGSNGNYYSFSATRPMAKEYLSALLSAQARGATVTFTGAGACNDQSVSETLRYFRIEN